MKTILIAGGGWGGLTAAHALQGMLPSGYRVAVIEARQSFVFYPSFLRVLTGERTSPDHVESPMRNLINKDIEIIHEAITHIHPETCTVSTGTQTLRADYL